MKTWSPMVTGASSRIVRLKLPTKWSPTEICAPKSQWNGLWMQTDLPTCPNSCRMIASRSSRRLGGSWLSRNTSSSVRSSAPPISGQMAWSQSPAFIFSRSPMIRWLLGGGSGFSNRKKHTPLPRCASLSDIPCYSETIASLGHTPAQVPQSIHLSASIT